MSGKTNALSTLRRANPGSALLIISMLAMVIIPLPPFLLDILFTFNITLSLVILMVAIYVVRPLEFSLFPTILLITTLLRLTLNIASTRVVLIHGHEGAGAAGEVIRAFGEVVIGGNFVVGMIVFSILMIINFIVVTKGAGRISEVSARFTLDAMPGKQMAVDADLNTGAITQDEARVRREEIIQESDFYGSMDGASKFVRGDAIAGLLILFINLVGGIIIGVFQDGMTLQNAMTTFSILTIGDGLAAQLPSLLLSISAAIIVTRVSNEQDINQQTMTQLFGNPRPLLVTGAILVCVAIVPGMPHLPLLSFAVIALITGARMRPKAAVPDALKNSGRDTAQATENRTLDADIDWNDVASVDKITLELGYGLVGLAGARKDGPLIARVRGIRKKLSQELGFLIPPVHVKDNLSLAANTCRVFLKGVLLTEATIHPDRLLAISPGHTQSPLPGIPCKDPTFGLDGYWITEDNKAHAQGLGYTIVDASTVIATNLNQIIRTQAGLLLGYEDVQQLITRLGATDPKLTEALTSAATGIPLNIIFSTLQKLLHSGIFITDFRTIAEKMVDSWSKSKDQDTLLEAVRIALKHLIVYNISGGGKELPVAVLDTELTSLLQKSIQVSQQLNEKIVVLEPSLTEKIYNCFLEYVRHCESSALPVILLLTSELRGVLEKLFKPGIPTMHFLSFNEVPEDKQIRIMERIGQSA